MKVFRILGLALSLTLQVSAWADTAPPCLSQGQNLAVDDAAVIKMKATTKNQFLARAHVQGPLTRLYPDKNGHHHFEIQIGSAATDTLEIVYNEGFGATPQVRVGDMVEACGDYITSNAATSQYPASPDGAIIHWIHMAPNPAQHPSGFLMINGVVYGQGKP